MEVETKAKALEDGVARQEKVVESIKVGEWSSERVFAAFDADKSDNLDVSELKVRKLASSLLTAQRLTNPLGRPFTSPSLPSLPSSKRR
jgi:hypothetical protein